MRLFTSILMTVAFLAAGAANAVTFSASSSATEIAVGEQVTIDVTVVLDQGDSLNALGADVYNYDPALSFVGGQAVGALFFQTAAALPPTSPTCAIVPSACEPADPMTSLAGGDLAESPAAGSGQARVNIVNAIDLFNQFVAQAFADPGLDGDAGTAQFSLVFEGAAPGQVLVEIGGGVDLNGVAGGDNVTGYNNAQIAITVIPEPGTALLMGLGLAGLATAGRRK